jgi:hypothetical protein
VRLEELRLFMAERDWNSEWAIDEIVHHDFRDAGWVYFAEADGATKIGFSKDNPDGRVSALQGGNPHPLKLIVAVPGDRRMEKHLHQMFYLYRLKGEWFRSDAFGLPELIRFYVFVEDAMERAGMAHG